MTGPDTGGRVPWIWDWFDDSPRGETYGVRREHEVLCYTDRTKQGFEDAVRIALAVNAAERESCPRQHTWPKGHPQDVKPWGDWDPDELVEALRIWNREAGQ